MGKAEAMASSQVRRGVSFPTLWVQRNRFQVRRLLKSWE